MIRRNVAGQVIYLPQLTTTDGTAITSSATLTVAKDGTEAASGGTLAHVSNGVWKYTPTQSETDAAIVGLILTGTSAVPVVLNLVTTAADTSAVALGANTTAPANSDIAAIKAKTDNLPNDPAGVSDVSPTIDFNPTIEPTPVTVNPTELSSGSVDAIRDGLATIAKQDEILGAIDNVSVELSSEDIEEISNTVSTAVSEKVEREGGMLQRLLSKFDGIDKLIRWIRQ
jgi:hypothetical protein